MRHPDQNGRRDVIPDKNQVEFICVDFKANAIAARKLLALEHPFVDVVVHFSSIVLISEKSAHSLGKADLATWLFSESPDAPLKKVYDNNLYLRIVNNKNDKDENFRGALTRPLTPSRRHFDDSPCIHSEFAIEHALRKKRCRSPTV